MFKLKKRVVISGHPGTGTSTLIDKLATLYNLKPEQVIKVGDLFRQNSKEKTGHDITGFYQRDITEDLSIDQMQKQLLADPNPNLVFILESRLGGFFTKEMGHPQNIVTILLTTDESVRLKRIFDRDKHQQPNLVLERQENDLKQWQEAYPQMISNPLDNPNLYDFQIDNTNLSVDQTVEAITHKLLQLKAIH